MLDHVSTPDGLTYDKGQKSIRYKASPELTGVESYSNKQPDVNIHIWSYLIVKKMMILALFGYGNYMQDKLLYKKQPDVNIHIWSYLIVKQMTILALFGYGNYRG